MYEAPRRREARRAEAETGIIAEEQPAGWTEQVTRCGVGPFEMAAEQSQLLLVASRRLGQQAGCVVVAALQGVGDGEAVARRIFVHPMQGMVQCLVRCGKVDNLHPAWWTVARTQVSDRFGTTEFVDSVRVGQRAEEAFGLRCRVGGRPIGKMEVLCCGSVFVSGHLVQVADGQGVCLGPGGRVIRRGVCCESDGGLAVEPVRVPDQRDAGGQRK